MMPFKFNNRILALAVLVNLHQTAACKKLQGTYFHEIIIELLYVSGRGRQMYYIMAVFHTSESENKKPLLDMHVGVDLQWA
jgi:hypothetical protein